MRDWAIWLCAIVLAGLSLAGCGEASRIAGSTFHQKFGWKAKDYFDDPQVIALCHAIEANDLAEMERLIAAGANVNAKGKDGMTPLLWAYPDNKLERFTKLLEHGANPNVIFESDFGTHGHLLKGESVTHLACDTSFPGYFEAVFEHGGDPNFEAGPADLHDTPIFRVIKFSGRDRYAKVQLLIDKGADLNKLNGAGGTPTMEAVSWGGQYDIAILLLKAGADPKVYQENELQKLTHEVVREDRRIPEYTLQQKAGYEELVKWLEDHGESLDEARKDLARRRTWSTVTGEFRTNANAEIAARKARDAKEKAADKNGR